MTEQLTDKEWGEVKQAISPRITDERLAEINLMEFSFPDRLGEIWQALLAEREYANAGDVLFTELVIKRKRIAELEAACASCYDAQQRGEERIAELKAEVKRLQEFRRAIDDLPFTCAQMQALLDKYPEEGK